MADKLTLVSLPIGNLSDITLRAMESLKRDGLFIVEDTRVFKKLCSLLEINISGKELISFNDHDQKRLDFYIEKINKSDVAFLLSDAGSPVLSDPAYPLIKAWVAKGGQVDSAPGASAVQCALEVSALAPLPYCFHGFGPRKKNEITELFKSLSSGITHIFFESPHRIETTLDLLVESLPSADIVVVRELTKKFEQHYRFKASEWDTIKNSLQAKGEFVLLFRNEHKNNEQLNSKVVSLADSYMSKPSPKSLARLIAEIQQKDVKEVYNILNK